MESAIKSIGSLNELELKGYLMGLIERAKDRSQLLLFAEAVADVSEDTEADEAGEAAFWSRYSPEQQADLEKSFEESYDPTQWVAHEDVMKKYAQWLK